MRPGTYVLIVTSPLNGVLNYLFCYTFKFGLFGAPIATSISYWSSFLLLLVYTRFVAGSEHWGGWSRKCLQNMGTFARLAAMGVIHVGTEWWAFEIVALAAGNLGTISLAAQSVIMTADQVMNTIPYVFDYLLHSSKIDLPQFWSRCCRERQSRCCGQNDVFHGLFPVDRR